MGTDAVVGKLRNRAVLVAVLVAALVVSFAVGAASASAANLSNTQNTHPQSAFTGSAGGDGWALSLGNVAGQPVEFNVFHHNSNLIVNCRNQVTGQLCDPAYPVQVMQDGNRFFTSGHPATYFDQSSSKLYIYVTRDDLTAGVECFDPSTMAGCGFIALGAPGQSGIRVDCDYWGNCYNSWGLVGAPMQVGSKWYAYNYAPGQPAGDGTTSTSNTVMCFDLSTDAACSGQPYTLNVGQGNLARIEPSPADAAVANKLMITAGTIGGSQLACFDPATNAECAGNWPASGGAPGGIGAPFPLMDTKGTVTGVCLPTGQPDTCFDLNGNRVPQPADLGLTTGNSSGWNGPSVTVGTRVFVPNQNSNIVTCYDYATSASCAGDFPKGFPNLGGLYTVNLDSANPRCLWVNSDAGGAQIQNFDAITGGPCGVRTLLVPASTYVAPGAACLPTGYGTLNVISPEPSAYSSGKVLLLDPNGNAIPSIPLQSLDANGVLDLFGLNLQSLGYVPQFEITLDGLTGGIRNLNSVLHWSGASNASCLGGGQTIDQQPTTLTANASSGSQSGPSMTITPWAPVSASATLGGASAPTAGGTADYTWFSDAGCTTSIVDNPQAVVNGSIPTFSWASLGVGTYYGQASYTGDATNGATTSACGGQQVTVAEPAPSGLAQDGQTLTAPEGPWSNADPGNFTYQWSDCDNGICAPITGATGSSYTLTPSDVGHGVELSITSNDEGVPSQTTGATVPVTPAPAAAVQVSLSDSTVPSGDSEIAATAKLVDGFGAVVPTQTGDTVNFTLPNGTTAEGSSNGDGTYSVAFLAPTTAGGYTVSAQDVSLSGQPSGVAPLSVTAGPAANVSLSLSPDTLVADGRSVATATATVTDANSNPVSGDPVTIAALDGGNGDKPSIGTVNAGALPGTYVAQITDATTAGQWSISATDNVKQLRFLNKGFKATLTNVVASPELTITPDQVVDLSLAPDIKGIAIREKNPLTATRTLTQVADKADKVTVTLSNPQITADGASTTTATAAVTDVNGNPVSGDDVTFAGGDGQSVSSVSELPAGSGNYVATITSTTNAGQFPITATDAGGNQPRRSADLTQVAGPVARLSMEGLPSLVADGYSHEPVLIDATDIYGNPVSVDPSMLALTSSGSQTFAPITETATAGQYASVVTASKLAGNSQITATYNNPQTEITLYGYRTLHQSNGIPSHISVSLSKPQITADGKATSLATITITDQGGNPIDYETPKLKLSSSDLAEGIGAITGHSVNLCFVAACLDSAVNKAAMVNPGLPEIGIPCIVPMVSPACGGLIPGGIIIPIGLSPGGSADLPAPPAVNPPSGSYVATITASTVAGLSTITAQDGALSATAPLTQLAGAPAKLALSLSPASVPADGRSTSVATVHVLDVNGNAVATGAEAKALAVKSDGSQVVSPVTQGASPGDYVATVTSTTKAGSSVISAGDGTLSAPTATLTQTADRAASVKVTLSRPQILADGWTTSLATATVTDVSGNPLTGEAVSFASDGAQTIGAVTPGTDPGTYQALVTSTTQAGTATITATDGTPASNPPSGSALLTQTAPLPRSSGIKVPTAPVVGPPAKIGLWLLPSKLPADGHSTTVAMVGVTDALGNALSGLPVALTSSGGETIGAVQSGSTPGIYMITLTAPTKLGTDTLTATVAGLTATAPLELVAAAPTTVSSSSPLAGAVFLLGEKVHASYSCVAGVGAAAVAACTGPVANGALLDTSTPGTHQFKVTALSSDGNRTRRTIAYTVLAPRATGVYLAGPISVTNGVLSLPLGCAGKAVCGGNVQLQIPLLNGQGAATRYITAQLGKSHVMMAGGSTSTLQIRLTKLGQRVYDTTGVLPTIAINVNHHTVTIN